MDPVPIHPRHRIPVGSRGPCELQTFGLAGVMVRPPGTAHWDGLNSALYHLDLRTRLNVPVK